MDQTQPQPVVAPAAPGMPAAPFVPAPEPPPVKPLSSLANLMVSAFDKEAESNYEKKITVSPIVAKFAAWFEKLRNAMEYREEEVVLRATIERVLRRRLLLGGNAKTTAEPLVRELVWARYLPDNDVPESKVEAVEQSIDNFLHLRLEVLKHRGVPESALNEWTYQLMSADIEKILNPNTEKETIANFMYQIFKEHIHVVDEKEETQSAQVYIAIRKAFARDDIAFLRYHLFSLYFGKLTKQNLSYIAEHFKDGYEEIVKQMQYRGKEKIYGFVKKRTAPFFILEHVMRQHKGGNKDFLQNEEALAAALQEACTEKYATIASKVRRAIFRSVIFILMTKVAFAFLVEGTYERIVYGEILWKSIIINTGIPPLLMVIMSFFITTPGKDNTDAIVKFVKHMLYDEHPKINGELAVGKSEKRSTVLNAIFTVTWLLAFLVSFGGIIYVLTRLEFNIVSQGIFIFFLAIVSFLAYRISLTANQYRLMHKQGLLTPLIDFFFMPVVSVGRQLTQEISRVNFLLFVFDFFIDAPFKVMFAFFEQWFLFLHAKREELE